MDDCVPNRSGDMMHAPVSSSNDLLSSVPQFVSPAMSDRTSLICVACGRKMTEGPHDVAETETSVPIAAAPPLTVAVDSDEEKEEEKEEVWSDDEDRATSMAKMRTIVEGDGSSASVGAVQVDEQAPQINRRFYLGLDRPGECERRAEARTAHRAVRRGSLMPPDSNGDNSNSTVPRRASIFGRFTMSSLPSARSNILVEATLVEDSDVFEAKTMGYCQRHWRWIVAIAVGILLPIALFGILYVQPLAARTEPNSSPTPLPTFDSRPTLEIVHERGYLMCGSMDYEIIDLVSSLLYPHCVSLYFCVTSQKSPFASCHAIPLD